MIIVACKQRYFNKMLFIYNVLLPRSLILLENIGG